MRQWLARLLRLQTETVLVVRPSVDLTWTRGDAMAWREFIKTSPGVKFRAVCEDRVIGTLMATGDRAFAKGMNDLFQFQLSIRAPEEVEEINDALDDEQRPSLIPMDAG